MDQNAKNLKVMIVLFIFFFFQMVLKYMCAIITMKVQ